MQKSKLSYKTATKHVDQGQETSRRELTLGRSPTTTWSGFVNMAAESITTDPGGFDSRLQEIKDGSVCRRGWP